MCLPQTLRATVSPDTIDKVGRLFNGGPADVVNELLQNARRAGATCVDIEILDLAGHATLAVRDDGRGIDDPRMLLTLGQSDWAERTRVSEDPAGMGVFSMAGLRVEYRSWSASAKQGWRVLIDPDAWAGKRLLGVELFDIGAGTDVLIDMPETWETRGLDQIVANAARHYPLPVRFNGQEQPRADWLQGALRIEHWEGSRIGIFCDAPRSMERDTLNFHGLTVPLGLPSVTEVDGGRQWSARIDIGDTPALQLVLPARKEVVQTGAIAALKQAVRAATLRAIAGAGEHRLAFEDYAQARALGIEIDEAAPYLFGWTPETADWGDTGERGKRTRGTMVPVGDQCPTVSQTFARALELADEEAIPRFVEAQPKFEGYGWYDALRTVVGIRIVVTAQGEQHALRDGEPNSLETGRVEAIRVELEVQGATKTRIISLPTDVAVTEDGDSWSGIDAITLLIAADATIGELDLADLLMRACFCPSDDRDADSWETQRDAVRRDALQLSRAQLQGENAGIIGRALDRVEDHIRWLVPEGRTLLIAVRRDAAMAVFGAAPGAGGEAEFIASIEAQACDDERAATRIRALCAERREALLARIVVGAGERGGGEAA